ncbi:hypothetical protein EDC04DRAFT_2610704 [Pisolithus marmoratus]|nr:hypothetical protein EDC04DRAFT_2610704 [Pisolithus marmoratus]
MLCIWGTWVAGLLEVLGSAGGSGESGSGWEVLEWLGSAEVAGECWSGWGCWGSGGLGVLGVLGMLGGAGDAGQSGAKSLIESGSLASTYKKESYLVAENYVKVHGMGGAWMSDYKHKQNHEYNGHESVIRVKAQLGRLGCIDLSKVFSLRNKNITAKKLHRLWQL